jgi:hypothetical protein
MLVRLYHPGPRGEVEAEKRRVREAVAVLRELGL